MSAANVIQCPSGYTLLKDETICFGTFWDQFNSDPSVPRPTSASNTKCYYNWLPEEGCMIHSGRSAHYQICPSGYGHVVSYNQQQPVCTKVKRIFYFFLGSFYFRMSDLSCGLGKKYFQAKFKMQNLNLLHARKCWEHESECFKTEESVTIFLCPPRNFWVFFQNFKLAYNQKFAGS